MYMHTLPYPCYLPFLPFSLCSPSPTTLPFHRLKEISYYSFIRSFLYAHYIVKEE